MKIFQKHSDIEFPTPIDMIKEMWHKTLQLQEARIIDLQKVC